MKQLPLILGCNGAHLMTKRNRHKEKTAPLGVAQALNSAISEYNAGRWVESERLCRAILEVQPNLFECLNLLGIIAAQTGHPKEAANILRRAVASRPENSAAHCNLGNALYSLGNIDDALKCYDQAVRLNPEYAEAYNNRGNTLRDLGRHDDALKSFDRALQIRENYPEAYNNRGVAYLAAKRYEDALRDYEHAIRINPRYAPAYNNRGYLQTRLAQFDAAMQSLETAINLRPDYAEAHNNKGFLLARMRRFEDAMKSFASALAYKPEYAEAYFNRANAFIDLRQYEAAIQDYRRVLELKPDFHFVDGSLWYARMHVCDWKDFDDEVRRISARVAREEPATPPFVVMSLADSAALQRTAATTFARTLYPESSRPVPHVPSRATRLRVGYFSADFRDHAVSHLAAGMFEAHDRERFEITAFSFGTEAEDDFSRRIRAACDRFVQVSAKSDREIALLARQMEIDVAVDLGGYTHNSRPGIFAQRAAPVQAAFLGYAGTTGASWMDYLVADSVVIPEGSEVDYSEKILYLPHCYLPTDSKRPVSETYPSREALGLPSRGFVFCCFNNAYKITPDIFDSWVRILSNVEDSVLWLSVRDSAAAANLRREATLRNLDADRLIFARRIPLQADHLARIRAADLFLDTNPYNAHTTACVALWVGVPVVTRIGSSFPGRVAASLLQGMDLPELITSTTAQYEQLCIALARDSQRLSNLRLRLAEKRNTAPLFKTGVFTQHLESAYQEVYARYRDGLPPDSVHVPSVT